MSDQRAHIEVVNTSIFNPFTNSTNYDVVFYSKKTNSIHIGCQSNNSMIQVSTSNVVIQGDLMPLGVLRANNIVGSNITCSNVSIEALTVASTLYSASNIVASNLTSSNVNGSNIHASNNLQTGGKIRISDKGHLSNVSACNGSNVYIDVMCLAGILPRANGGTGVAATITTGTNNIVMSTSPTIANLTCAGTSTCSGAVNCSILSTPILSKLTVLTSISTPSINIASRGDMRFDFGSCVIGPSTGNTAFINFTTDFVNAPTVLTCPKTSSTASGATFTHSVNVVSVTSTRFEYENSIVRLLYGDYAGESLSFTWMAIGK